MQKKMKAKENFINFQLFVWSNFFPYFIVVHCVHSLPIIVSILIIVWCLTNNIFNNNRISMQFCHSWNITELNSMCDVILLITFVKMCCKRERKKYREFSLKKRNEIKRFFWRRRIFIFVIAMMINNSLSRLLTAYL